jgi:[protein-PII] uridylyltransferase
LAGGEPVPASPSLRAARLTLLDDRSLTGTDWCRQYAAAADRWLAGVLDRATERDPRRVALLAVGGYGRGELAPSSDLDLVLVHDRRGSIKAIADAVWYPIWDAGLHLDHSVRTAKDVRSAMDDDIKVALGLLDGRRVAGDENLAAAVLDRALEQWRTRAGRWLPVLDQLTRRRHLRFGDLAFLLEPDLKEARGGLRDAHLLRSLGRVIPILAAILEDPGLDAARDVLAAARVETHRLNGRPANQLLLQDQDAVADALHYPDADALMAAVAGAGRAGAWLNDDGWRRIESWLAGPAGRRGSADHALEPGLVLRDGEVTLTGDAPTATDPSLALRTAAASAELDRPIARTTLDRLGQEAVAPGGAWTPETLHALLRLLGAGPPSVAAVEALDQRGIWLRYLPEWAHVRNRPQRNAYHRFTVDRHLLETAANAAGLARSVARPDLLLLGALFHDIGKGLGGDHTEEGIELVGKLGPRLGLPEGDVETLVTLVRHHLLLPDTATRRDLDDPATAEATAKAVGDRDTLDLLAALTEADSMATGPSAWGPWKAGLVQRLVEVTAARLEGRAPAEVSAAALGPRDRARLDLGVLEVVFDDGRLLVAAPDRAGLLATTAGVLTLSGVTVRSATTLSDEATGMALLSFVVAPAFDRLPDWASVRADLEAALDGRLALGAALHERERHYARYRRFSAAAAPEVRVTVDDGASATATVVEVRAPDRGPVLYQVTGAIASCGLTITCALVNTLGAEAIDVFYVQTVAGGKVTDAGEQRRLTDAVRAALGPAA